MGVCYTLLLLDDFNWDYADAKKDERIARFIKEMNEAGAYCNPIAQWYGAAVFDLDKSYPHNIKILNVIVQSCDVAYYIADNQACEIVELKRTP